MSLNQDLVNIDITQSKTRAKESQSVKDSKKNEQTMHQAQAHTSDSTTGLRDTATPLNKQSNSLKWSLKKSSPSTNPQTSTNSNETNSKKNARNS